MFNSNRTSNSTIHEKSPQKFNVFGIIADTPGVTAPVLYIFRKLFSRATFGSQIVCLYLEAFKSYLASNMTILEKYFLKFNIHAFDHLGNHRGYRHVIYIFRKPFLRATFASQIAGLYLEQLKKYKALKLTILKKYAKIHIFPYRELLWENTVPHHTFLESSRQAGVKPKLACNAVTYRFRDIRVLEA